MLEQTYLVYAIARIEGDASVDVTKTLEEAVKKYPFAFVRNLETPPAEPPTGARSREGGPVTSRAPAKEFMTSIDIDAVAFPTATQALLHTKATGLGSVVALGGITLVVCEDEAQRLEEAGIQFAYLREYDGRLVTITTNGPFCVCLVDPVEEE